MRAETLAQLSRDAARRVSLHGVVAEAEIEQTVSAMRVGTVMAAISAQQAKEAEIVARAEQDGVLIEPNGSNDVAYSQQRADEVTMRIIANQRSLAAAEADLAAMQGRLKAEEEHFARYSHATVMALASGMIWRSGTAEGERVRPGDPIVQTVDCGAAILTAVVPLDRMADIDVRIPAIVRFSGSQESVAAKIIATPSDTALRDDKTTAAVPASSSRPTGMVVLEVPSSSNNLGQCLVGRTARVKLSVIHTGLMAQLQRLAPF
jgi:biotin carboxyl carrier protein